MKSFWKDKSKMFKKDKKPKYPKPRLPGPRKNEKQGQMFMITIIVLIMAFIVFIATLPATKEMINSARQCNYLNCAGYVDPDATSGSVCSTTNRTYDPTLEEDTLTCMILDLALPFLILGVLAGLIYKITIGRGDQVQQQFPGY